MIQNPLWWMLVAHALCDFPLQGDFLARGKNHTAPIPGVPWYLCLLAHSLIHGGAVAFITGSIVLGAGEVAVHAVIDYAKCDGKWGFGFDQVLHVYSKLVWFALLECII